MSYKLLIVNPGSTSTKVAVFNDKEQVFKKNIKHSVEDLAKFDHIADQFSYRKDMILNELKTKASISTVSALSSAAAVCFTRSHQVFTR